MSVLAVLPPNQSTLSKLLVLWRPCRLINKAWVAYRLAALTSDVTMASGGPNVQSHLIYSNYYRDQRMVAGEPGVVTRPLTHMPKAVTSE